eukprot:870195_1
MQAIKRSSQHLYNCVQTIPVSIWMAVFTITCLILFISQYYFTVMLLSCVFTILMMIYKLPIDMNDFKTPIPVLKGIDQQTNSNDNRSNRLTNTDRLHLLLSENDFNPNDFSFLNRLDQDNNESMIKGLNTSLIQQIIPSQVVEVDIEEECAICLRPQKTKEEIRILPCHHRYHAECVDLWLNRRAHCPMCKLKVHLTVHIDMKCRMWK